MGTHADPDISVLEDLIQAYLQDHPRAADTALGVVEWWLPKDGAATVEQVEAALDHLVLKGIVDRREASDGGSLYRLRVRRH